MAQVLEDIREFEQFIPTYLDVIFDVASISELSHGERAAFKPVYSMNKWWARRSSTVFRALLLGLALRPEADLMEEFYRSHQGEPNVEGKVILDPFMGGGTTVVEALRLGYKAVGVDLNPLSWFIVKTETTEIDLDALKMAFEVVRSKVAEPIAEMYATRCPCCSERAEATYAFWSKAAPCAWPGCDSTIHLFRDYVVGQRRGNVNIPYREVECPSCRLRFDWELERADMVHDRQAVVSGEKPWSFSMQQGVVECPGCDRQFDPPVEGTPPAEKEIPLFALLCPACDSIFSLRGDVPEHIECPVCAHAYNPKSGTTDRGGFKCPRGHQNTISEAATAKGAEAPLKFRLYGIEGYCPNCASARPAALAPRGQVVLPGMQPDDVDAAGKGKGKAKSKQKGCPNCRAVNHKFFKKPDREDLARYTTAEEEWERRKGDLPWPKDPIHDYEKTNRLVIHNYKYWHQLFNPRQLLALSMMLRAIMDEPEQALKEALLAAFLGTLEHENMMNIYYVPYAQSAGAFGRHDFHPKVMACEGNPWGGRKGRGTFLMAYKTVLSGKGYLLRPYDAKGEGGRRKNIYTGDSFSGRVAEDFEGLVKTDANLILKTRDSRSLDFLPAASIDHVVTDPPYADAVQYAELSDFFYVWLREALGEQYADLLREPETPKTQEIVENIRRQKSQKSFYEGLEGVFQESRRVLKPDGRLVFTFHHSKGSQWAELLEVLLRSGFELTAVYPVKSEATESGNLVFHSNANSIAYDIIHVCRKASEQRERVQQMVSWEELQPSIRQKVRRHVQAIRASREQGHRIAEADARVMLWGECLAVYSHHYGHISDAEGKSMSITAALDAASGLVEEVLHEPQAAA